MKKFWKVLGIIFDIVILAAVIIGLIYLARWAKMHNIIDVGDVFRGL